MSRDFFGTVGIALVQGRTFTASEEGWCMIGELGDDNLAIVLATSMILGTSALVAQCAITITGAPLAADTACTL